MADRSALAGILDGTIDQLDEDDAMTVDTSDAVSVNDEGGKVGFCVECEDQPSVVFCKQCNDAFCQVCFMHQHRKGTRKTHELIKTATEAVKQETKKQKETIEGEEELIDVVTVDEFIGTIVSDPQMDTGVANRAKFIPLRLTGDERKLLRLLEAALNVSEYTDKIDILLYGNKNKRIVAQIKELCAILSGLVLAADYKTGQSLFQDRDFEANKQFYQDIFELGRRHKIMNPEKMRNTYGKLVYLPQDAQIPEVKEMLQFSCVKPIKTVYSVLEENNCLAVLQDSMIETAIMEIVAEGQKRHEIQQQIKQKEKAIEYLVRKYKRPEIDADLLRQCLYSIGDNNAFLRTNRDPCEQMIVYLKQFFDATKAENGLSLAIQSGREGARLSHGHDRQYQYVLQSLTLWREILHDMFMLWTLAETDLLEASNYYSLRDTGQGLNRVQPAPRVSRMMHTILARAQQRVGSWVGSSVIHLGDHNVPNALMFIDKYTQIYRILLPIVSTVNALPKISRDPEILAYINSLFGSVDKARKTILCDFFRHGFDGSGADNFFDAGSCIDGRLTSAWNWCSMVEKKRYFPLFLLTGFIGFDGGSFQ